MSPSPAAGGGTIQGTITTQNATIPLGGVTVDVSEGTSTPVQVVSEGDGTFRFEHLQPGQYKVTATLEGFEPIATTATVTADDTTKVALDLRLAVVGEQVEVVAAQTVLPSAGTLASSEVLSSRELEQISPGGGLTAALRLIASVIQVPGGIAIKGGRPSQASVQLGPGIFVDPTTGLSPVSLPDDAIDSITVLPNPYAVEFGRFSSGLVLIQTRRAADRWRMRLNNLDPSFRTKRGSAIHITGIAAFSPRFELGGPIIKDKLFVQQSAQFRYRTSDVASRPASELKKARSFSSFTRFDANLSTRHSMSSTLGFFPATAKFATLGTFTPPEATVDLHGGAVTGAVTERSLWSDHLFSETTFEGHRYQTEVRPQEAASMVLLPDTTLGAFFNRQHRTTDTYQVVETVSGSTTGRFGLHLYKFGLDMLHSRFDGTSVSMPVRVRRTDGTLARQLAFSGPTSQNVSSTDLALFAQDRVQPNARWYVEFGGRLDRDGVIGRFSVTPRIGTAVLLNESGSAVIRSGLGLFYERTPSAAGAFEDYDTATETRFATDGVTPLGPPRVFRHIAGPNLRTSHSVTWDLGFDQKFNPRWSLHVGAIDRRGSHELLVEPESSGPLSALRLQSDGRSRYREVEFGVHFTGGQGVDVNASYVRSMARADLNAFTTFYDSILWPIIGENQYAPARADAPHRLLIRGRAIPRLTWLFTGVLDWRTGLPYSIVDENLDFVGRRNDHRFPTYVRLDLGIEHRFKIGKIQPWIGVRADNALSSFLPADVQANISSPAFGTFYNSEYRQFRIQFRFER